MAWYRIAENVLDAIANAINAKTGKTAPMTPVDMVSEIQSIQTGGGSDFVLIDTFTIAEDVRVFEIDISNYAYNEFYIKINATATGADYLYFNYQDNTNQLWYTSGNAYNLNCLCVITPPNSVIGTTGYLITSAIQSHSSAQAKTSASRPTSFYFIAYRTTGVLNAGGTIQLYGR